jgi:hypothetical protein
MSNVDDDDKHAIHRKNAPDQRALISNLFEIKDLLMDNCSLHTERCVHYHSMYMRRLIDFRLHVCVCACEMSILELILTEKQCTVYGDMELVGGYVCLHIKGAFW